MGVSAIVAAIADTFATTVIADAVLTGAAIGAGGAVLNGGDIGDILEGAALGGITGGIAGPTAGFLGELGAGATGSLTNTLATGAVLGGGNAAVHGGDILQGALLGGLTAGVFQTVANEFGGTTQIFDDGSTLSTDASGSVVSSTPATDGTLAPVVDLSPGNVTQTFDDGSTLTTNSLGDVINTTNATDTGLTGLTGTTGNTTQTFDDGSTLTTDASGNVVSTTDAHTTQIFDDGSTLTTDSSGNVVSGTDIDGNSVNLTGGNSGTTTTTFDDGSTITYDKDGNVISTTDATDTGVITTGGTTTGTGTTTGVIGSTVGGVVGGVGTDGKTTTGTTVADDTLMTYDLPDFSVSNLKTNFGLNPGMITPVAAYHPTSDVGSRFAWGASPMQTGATFDPGIVNVNAPAVPWGLQQMYHDLTPQEMASLVQAPLYQQASLGTVAGPVAPAMVK